MAVKNYYSFEIIIYFSCRLCYYFNKEVREMTVYIWLGVLALTVIVEIATTQLVSIWFTAGALAAFLVALAGVKQLWIQIVVFVAVSAIALAVTRPLVKKIVNRKAEPTNADMVIGKTGVVLEEINNLAETGLVKVGGSTWTARSTTDCVINKDETVTIKEIKGVKLFVEQI